MVEEIQCPIGCGPMEYKTNRNLKVRVFDPIGYALMIGGLPFIVGYFDTVPIVISYMIGFGLLMLGAYRTALVTTDLSCNTCSGVILESKSIDQRLKGGDFLGFSENKADYIRTALSSSTEDSEHDCPDCGEKMSSAKIPFVKEKDWDSDNLIVPEILEDDLIYKICQLDGCKECDLIWFKKAKMERRLSSEGTMIPAGLLKRLLES